MPKAGNLVEVTNPFISEDLGNTWLGVVVGESNVTITVHFADDNAKHEYRKASINNPNSNSYVIMNIVSQYIHLVFSGVYYRLVIGLFMDIVIITVYNVCLLRVGALYHNTLTT